MSSMIMGVLIGISAVTLIICLVLMRRNNQNKTNQKLNISAKRNTKNYLHYLYRLYMVTPVVGRYFKKMKNRYRTIFPADEVTLNKKTTERMTLCLGVSLGILIAVIFICSGDVTHMLAGLLACYIIFTNMVNSSEQSMQIKLLNQLDTFLSDVHSYYHDTEMVDEAISSTLDDLPYEIGLHANKIYNIVTATDVEAEVEKYIDVAPNQFLLLLATICASVQEYGDKILEDGRSLFLKNLNYLKSELNEERLRLQRRITAFTGKVFSVLIPIFCLKPIEMWAISNMPDLKEFYNGGGGTISMAIIIVTTFICYEAINILKDDHSDEGKDDRVFKAISEIPVVKKYLKLQIEHNYTKSRRMADALKATGDKSGINIFMTKRILLALFLMILTTAVAIGADGRSKKVIKNDFSEAYTSALVPNEEYRQQMRDMSLSLNGYVKNNTATKEDILAAIGTDLTPSMAELVAEELISRRDAFAAHYFKAYVLLLALGAGVIGYFIPLWLLKYKKSIMGMNRENEVSLFRTVILILMHEDGMMLDSVLEWMERFAHAFKASIADCIINLEYSQQEALEKMKEAESGFSPFRRLCDSLLAVDKVGLEGAFDDLETEREYYQEKRKLDNAMLLKKCSRLASYIQMVPLGEIIIIYLVLPFGTQVMNMMLEFTSII